MNADTPIKGAPFAAIDFETTGFVGPDTHVVEVAVVHGTFGSDDVRVVLSQRVRPPVAIPESASRVHGITDADVAACPAWAEVAPRVMEALDGRLPIAYNAPADFCFLHVEELRRMGLLGEDWTGRTGALWRGWRWLDLLVVRKATKTRGRPGKLVEVADEHGVVLDAHGAAGDALTTALLVRPMMRAAWMAGAFNSAAGAQPRRWEHVDEDDDIDDYQEPAKLETIGQILTWQRGAALYQERDFADYIRRQGGKPPQSYHHLLEGVPAPTWDTSPKPTLCRCGAQTLRRIGQDGKLAVVNVGDGSVHACGGAA